MPRFNVIMHYCVMVLCYGHAKRLKLLYLAVEKYHLINLIELTHIETVRIKKSTHEQLIITAKQTISGFINILLIYVVL